MSKLQLRNTLGVIAYIISTTLLFAIVYLLLYCYSSNANQDIKRDFAIHGCLVSETEVGIFLFPRRIYAVYCKKKFGKDLVPLFQKTKHLRALHLENCEVDTLAFVQVLQSTAIELLFISGKSLTDQQFIECRDQLSSIKYIYAYDTELSDNVLMAIADMPNIVALLESDNRFTEEGICKLVFMRPDIVVADFKNR